jgi:hypothetical protein
MAGDDRGESMTREERIRRAAEAEGGQPVSAGARVSHVRASIETGRGIYVDLTKVPVDQRQAVADKIRALIDEWSTTPRTRDQHTSRPETPASK